MYDAYYPFYLGAYIIYTCIVYIYIYTCMYTMHMFYLYRSPCFHSCVRLVLRSPASLRSLARCWLPLASLWRRSQGMVWSFSTPSSSASRLRQGMGYIYIYIIYIYIGYIYIYILYIYYIYIRREGERENPPVTIEKIWNIHHECRSYPGNSKKNL